MVNEFTQFGMRTGHVDLIDYDMAVLKKTGALLDTAQNEWYLPLSFYFEDPAKGPVAIERALVVYKRPEPTQVQHEVPQIAIIRDDIDLDVSRFYSPTVQYRQPCAGSTTISVNGCLGASSYETKDKEDPYNFTYTIECWARYRTVAQFLLQRMMAAFSHRGTIKVLATEEAGRNVECDRTYLFFQRGIADLTEVNSMVERIPGYSLTIQIEGELTLSKTPSCEQAFTGQTGSTPPPGDPVDPNLPGDGLYGNGFPNIRATLLEE